VGEHTRTEARPPDGRLGSLGELIHAAVRHAIEVAVDEELTAALGARPYERGGGRGGYRNGTKARTLTGPTGPLALAVPRARLFTPTGRREWASHLLPRYQRRLREVNETVVATYLAGANTLWAERHWTRWYFWATHSRLTPVIGTARLIQRHLPNVLTFFAHRITNAVSEGLNSKIQTIKKMAYGFRNREHFKTAIYFHCGGLDLYPVTHSIPG
jgi:transposase-like protein